MPSPVGHALAGLTVHALTASGRPAFLDPRRLAVVVGAALAPDLDLLFRLIDGRNHHQNAMHSIGAAVLAGLAVALWGRVRRHPGPIRLGLLATFGWLSHVGLDL